MTNQSDLEFVEDNWRNIGLIDNHSEELCLQAININPQAILYLQSKVRTKQLYLAAVKRDGVFLEICPKEFLTYEICLNAVKQNAIYIRYVPDDFKTYELCLEAVSKNGWMLMYVPDEFRTEELCLEAIKNNSRAFLINFKKTPKIWEEAIKRYPELYHKHRNPPQELTDLYNLLTL